MAKAKADYGLKHLKLAKCTESDLSGYYQCSSTTSGAKKVVADSASPTTDEIKIGSVTPYKSSKTLAVDDYVVNVSLPIGSYIDFENIVGLPTFGVLAIVKDSFSYTDSAPSVTNVEIEDSDEYFASFNADAGTQGFTLQTYDMSAEAYAYLMGYSEGDNGWNEETVGFELDNQCVEIETKGLDGFPPKKYQWARMKIKCNKTGTIGKSGFPNFQLEFTKLANFDSTGAEISGARWKEITD